MDAPLQHREPEASPAVHGRRRLLHQHRDLPGDLPVRPRARPRRPHPEAQGPVRRADPHHRPQHLGAAVRRQAHARARARAAAGVAGPADRREPAPGAPRKAAEWAEQQANVAFWIAKTHAAEDFSGPRDEAMALNTVWWYRHMKSKTLLSAHNAHVGYLGEFPPHTFKRQGTWLRQILGPRYLAMGASFYKGTFTALDENTGYIRRFTVGPPPPINAEQVLNRVPFPKYYLDMRTVDQPARSWLREEHQVRYITAVYSPTAVEENNIVQPLGRTYSVLYELRDTTPSNLIPGIPLGPGH
ncbi:erythromycin esterase family protein [Actinomadura luteofluorescens]|uniref:erythromycin esterase family protein n=1 Tax=Actinomadura luteofluorescens TaxID=46163 RepID=UPI00363A1A75